jgi:hypothetical protein
MGLKVGRSVARCRFGKGEKRPEAAWRVIRNWTVFIFGEVAGPMETGGRAPELRTSGSVLGQNHTHYNRIRIEITS